MYCDEHAVGQQSTVETLFVTVAKQRNNGSDQCFLWGPFTGYIVQSYGNRDALTDWSSVVM
jgi:hypothetical protein